MFRERTAYLTPHATEPAGTDGGWAHGFCFLARQERLYFGSDRREPVSWRPTVSWKRYGPLVYVLPATSQQERGFFHLPKDACFYKRLPQEPQDSYLFWRVEGVVQDALIKVGVLPHGLRIDIAKWLRERRMGNKRQSG
jgi:hypothetical protein